MTRCSPPLSLWWTFSPRTLDIWCHTHTHTNSPTNLPTYPSTHKLNIVKVDLLRWTSVRLRTVWTAMLVNVALVSSPSRVISLFERNSMRINVSASKCLESASISKESTFSFWSGIPSVVLSWVYNLVVWAGPLWEAFGQLWGTTSLCCSCWR